VTPTERAAEALGAEIEFFDAGDYPLRLTEAHMERLTDVFRELNPGFVLTHSLEDPYNVDHPAAAAYAQEARIVAQAMGYKPQADYNYSAPPVFLFEPHQPEQCEFKPDMLLDVTPVWETKRKAMESMEAQKHIWEYYTDLGKRRGTQAVRNGGNKNIRYAEAFQRVFPEVTDTFS